MINKFLVTVQDVYQEIHLIVYFVDSLNLDRLILADRLFAKVLQRVGTFLSISNNLWEKLASSLEVPNIFDDNFRVIPISYFVDFIL